VTFAEVKKLISQAMFADNQILAKIGLQQLADHYSAYPMAQGKTSICVLIKKGLSPKAVAALTEADAQGKILVLEKNGSTGWSKVWPESAK
jgi:hypothetical protein